LHDSILNPWLHILKVGRVRQLLLALVTWISLVSAWLSWYRIRSKVELFLRGVRRLRLRRLWNISWHIVRVCIRRYIITGWSVSMRECSCRWSIGHSFVSTTLKLSMLRRRVLNQEAVLIFLHFIWLLVLLVSFFMRWIANLIDLSTLRVTHRGRTVAIYSAIPVSDVSYRLFISAGILRVRFFI
jgi:hypothetical protein